MLRPCKGRGRGPPTATQDIFGWQDIAADQDVEQDNGDMEEVAAGAEACAESIIAFTEKLDSIDAAAFWPSCKHRSPDKGLF